MANLEHDPVEKYRTLRETRRRFEEGARLHPSYEDIYQMGIAKIEPEMDEVAKSEAVQVYAWALLSAIKQATRPPEDLQRAAAEGFIDQKELERRQEQVLEDFRKHPDFELVLEYEKRYGGPREETTETKPPEIVTAEEEKLPRVRITILPDDQVKINGRTIRTSLNQPRQRNYGPERIALLKALIRRKGETLDPYTLWKEAFGKKRPFDKDTMERARSWFRRYLTYNGKEIVTIHAGNRRGITARYGIVDFDAELKEIRPQDKYSFPDGHTIRGDLATLMKMLEKSSEEKPLTIEQISMGLYGTVDKSKRTSVRYDIASLKALVREKLGRELVSTFDPQHPFAKKTHYFLR